MNSHSVEQQMAAACAVDPRTAARLLDVDEQNNALDSPDSLSRYFNFTPDQLRAYIIEAPMRASEIENRALNNRASPAPYIREVEHGFHVGWYDGTPGGYSDVAYHEHIADAVTDFVLAYWKLPRLTGVAVTANHEKELMHREVTRESPFRSMIRTFRQFLNKWLGV